MGPSTNPPPGGKLLSTADDALSDAQRWTAAALVLGLLAAALCLLLPRIDGDAAVYGLLAKHMVTQHDWVKLVFRGADWLDKPHFPFWLVALSFELFGVGARAYQVPGLLLWALGAWATRQLAAYWFDQRVAALALLLFLGLLGPLLAVSDQKAEVYLIGLMPAASLAWLRFRDSGQWRHGLLLALLAACAMMTKGVFVLILLAAGPVLLTLCQRGRQSPVKIWHWAALVLVFVLCLLPELLSLYAQFDSQPAKARSGLRFFFWDSQFGRFFNTGPIRNTHGQPWFYLHNLLWTFYPWVWLLVVALLSTLRRLLRSAGRAPQGLGTLWSPDFLRDPGLQAELFLWAGFLAAFLLFSATSYQMDYYLIIVFPYAAITCAHWLLAFKDRWPKAWLLLQMGFSALVALLAFGLCVAYLATGHWGLALPLTLLLFVWLLVQGWRTRRRLTQMLALGLASVGALFAFSVQFHADLYQGYNVGRQIAAYTNAQPALPVVMVNVDSNTFDFLNQSPVLHADDVPQLQPQLPTLPQSAVYLLTMGEQVPVLMKQLALAEHCDKAWSDEELRSAKRLRCQSAHAFTLERRQEFIEQQLPAQFVRQLLVKPGDSLPQKKIVLWRFVRDA